MVPPWSFRHGLSCRGHHAAFRKKLHLSGLFSFPELALIEPGTGSPPRPVPQSFFISYSRRRPHEADFAEMILRRRGLEVFRDERDFLAGEPIAAEMEAHIRRAHVFVAMWCAEYACSPWCHDELEFALDLHAEGRLQLAIFCLDDIRIVPPRARGLRTLPCHDRATLEVELLKLCEAGR